MTEETKIPWARKATINLEEYPDGIDLTIRRPRPFGVVIYGIAMWMPLVALIAVIMWLFSGGEPVPSRTATISLIGFVPAGILYCVVALMSRPGWARVQRIRIRGNMLYKHYPFGKVDSLAMPVQLDLARYHACSAVVEGLKKDEKKSDFRPPLRNRVRIDCNYNPTLWLGPSLTLDEGAHVADLLNEYFDNAGARG